MGLWSFFSNHDSMIEKAEFESYSGDPLPYLLPDPSIEQSVRPYFMARIVDAQAFVSQYPFLPGQRESWRIRIEDPNAPWNEGKWELTVDEQGKGYLELAGAGAGDILLASIGTWTALLTGYAKAATLTQTRQLRGPEQSALKLAERIAARTPNLMDYF
ncbi:Sterol carrier protein domain-containing protein [Paenibacillaceae bacterium GAS479]|nr:Sterol carrier protein domain-containing protein [Paenibacillaceae bacterium GAS479]